MLVDYIELGTRDTEVRHSDVRDRFAVFCDHLAEASGCYESWEIKDLWYEIYFAQFNWPAP